LNQFCFFIAAYLLNRITLLLSFIPQIFRLIP